MLYRILTFVTLLKRIVLKDHQVWYSGIKKERNIQEKNDIPFESKMHQENVKTLLKELEKDQKLIFVEKNSKEKALGPIAV